MFNKLYFFMPLRLVVFQLLLLLLFSIILLYIVKQYIFIKELYIAGKISPVDQYVYYLKLISSRSITVMCHKAAENEHQHINTLF